ncbi:MAG TPA: emp24/gp25L/p24 family protein [Candidatus Bathyarchaeia archaeon]|nr:emp24/gp25L/p24 family protein [Candidatus Bathyarchaeia archaeon]
MRHSRKPLCLLIILSLTLILTEVAQAKTESINVEPGKEVTRTINLASGDRITITFTVLGPDPSTIHFYMVLPNGTTSDHGEISQYTIAFFTDVKGECRLHFDNSNSSSAQLVTLNYEVEHDIFGIPQMFFLLISITVLLAFVAVGYMLMGKYG